MDGSKLVADVSESLGRHARSWRLARGYSQEAMAIEARLSTPTYRRIECVDVDNYANPTLQTMVAVLSALGTSEFVMNNFTSALDQLRPE